MPANSPPRQCRQRPGFALTERPTLDLIGLKCPLPALRLRKALLALAPGTVIEARASDPLANIDIPNTVRELGDQLLSQASKDGVYSFTIEKAAAL